LIILENFFILVVHQNTIEKQMGIHVIDSGIGNPNRVKEDIRNII
jgi:hypothetical protein